MKILVGAHTLLLWLAGGEGLGPKTRAMIASPANELMVSVVSLWEIAVQIRAGAAVADLDEIIGVLPAEGFRVLPLEMTHLARLQRVSVRHRDPFFHVLMAQAKAEGAMLITNLPRGCAE